MKNPKVFWLSIIALGFLALTFLVNWLIIIILNQRELMKKK